MEREGDTLLRKGAIEVAPPHKREFRFIVPKKDGGFRLILDWRLLNRSVSRLKFRMLTIRQVVTQIRSEDWFVPIYLEDAYFHISYSYFLFPVLWPGLTGQPRLFHPLALDLLCTDTHWEGTDKSCSVGISFPQLEFPKWNPGSSRERDAASRCHTSGIQCWLHSSCRHWIHRTCFYTSWSLHHLACDVSPILGQILLMFRVGYAEGVPLVSSDAASRSLEEHTEEEFFIGHIHNYTEYNQQWNLCSVFNSSKCTHTWSPVQWAANAAAPGEQLGVRCLAQGSHLSHGQFLPEPRF